MSVNLQQFADINETKIKEGFTSADIIYAKYTYSNLHTMGNFSEFYCNTEFKPYKKIAPTYTLYGTDMFTFEFLDTPTHPECYRLKPSGLYFNFAANYTNASTISSEVKYLFETNSIDNVAICIPNDVAIISKEPIDEDTLFTKLNAEFDNIGVKFAFAMNGGYYTISSGALSSISKAQVYTNGFTIAETINDGVAQTLISGGAKLIVIISVDTTGITGISDFDFSLDYAVYTASLVGTSSTGKTDIDEYTNFYLVEGAEANSRFISVKNLQKGIKPSDVYADKDIYGANYSIGYDVEPGGNDICTIFFRSADYLDYDEYMDIYGLIDYRDKSFLSNKKDLDYENYYGTDQFGVIAKANNTAMTEDFGLCFRPIMSVCVQTEPYDFLSINPGRIEDFYYSDTTNAQTIYDNSDNLEQPAPRNLPMIKFGIDHDSSTWEPASGYITSSTREMKDIGFKFVANFEHVPDDETVTEDNTLYIKFAETSEATNPKSFYFVFKKNKAYITDTIGGNVINGDTVANFTEIKRGNFMVKGSIDEANPANSTMKIYLEGEEIYSSRYQFANKMHMSAIFAQEGVVYVSGFILTLTLSNFDESTVVIPVDKEDVLVEDEDDRKFFGLDVDTFKARYKSYVGFVPKFFILSTAQAVTSDDTTTYDQYKPTIASKTTSRVKSTSIPKPIGTNDTGNWVMQMNPLDYTTPSVEAMRDFKVGYIASKSE